jgi:serine/threonine-protein kinase
MMRGASFDLFFESVGSAGRESLLYSSPESENPTDWSADGRWILYNRRSQANFGVGDIDICALSLAGSAQPVPIVATQYSERQAALSRDGKWVAYDSRESGEEEIYVQSFRGQRGKWRISTRGGAQPSWRGDARELYYLAPPRSLMAVTVEPGSPPRFSVPRKLFDAPDKLRSDTRNQYVPARDGQRFLFPVPEGEGKVGTTTVMLNWPTLLER